MRKRPGAGLWDSADRSCEATKNGAYNLSTTNLAGTAAVVGFAYQEFKASPNFLCRWCKFRTHCPAGNGETGLDQLDPEPATTF
jgi:hypothetical protein